MGQPRKGAAPLEKVTARFKTENGKACDEWEVLEMDVLERIGEPTDGKLVIAATTNRFYFQPLLGKSCVLILSRGANRKRCFKGIVYRIEHRGEYPFGSVARINFASTVAALQHGQDSRVWEDRTAPQIIEEVFKEALEPFGREVRLKLTRIYAVREYCVQYKESDWDFVKRLMVDEGISFYLDESGEETDREVLVLVDANDAFPEIETMGDEVEAPPAPMPPPVQSSTWIEARVVWDQSGEPVADLPVVIEPPGGSRTMRSTSSDGLVRLDPIDPGPCEARCSFAGLKVAECVEFAGMGEERSSRSPARAQVLRPRAASALRPSYGWPAAESAPGTRSRASPKRPVSSPRIWPTSTGERRIPRRLTIASKRRSAAPGARPTAGPTASTTPISPASSWCRGVGGSRTWHRPGAS